jgi:hypothetical protein
MISTRWLKLRLETLESRLAPADVSAPVILQWFEGTYQTMEKRAADIFAAGYGVVYTPPPGRADSGDLSVGYDVYNRFDLGSPGRPTAYGTETGLKTAIDVVHRLGGTWTVDFVANHAGFSDQGTGGFTAAGGYPGLAITLGNDIDGDFHSAFAGGDIEGRLAGLVDIAQEKNHQMIRHPVELGNPSNIPAGTTPAFGRLANVPDPNNRRFYPDRDLQPMFLFDPATGESGLAIYPFNTANPLAGDASTENALGLIMRNAQWLVQTVGVDGLRLDAVKHFPNFVLNFLDRAVYRSNPRTLLDGSTNNVFSFSEIFDGDKGYLQSFIRKDINPGDPGRIGGDRDVLDFPLFFAMRDNLTGNGFTNDWRNIVNASQDSQDDGIANNGSQGVAFVSSHDSEPPHLSTVAYAYTLMRPGNAVVYFNGKELGDNRDFPKDGRGDALGGLYGDAITKLVDIRNTHGRGNYIERWLEKEMLIYEREKSALVVLSNRIDPGFDSRTVQTTFAPGTKLIELTGNASDGVVDPFNDFPEVLTVNGDGTVNLRVPRNVAPNGVEHNRGYFIYGLAGPRGSLSLTNDDQTLAGETPNAGTNGSARLSSIDVIASDTFQVRLNTNAVNLLGSIRDRDADGDNALLRIDGGFDANDSGQVDYRSPGSSAYGFEEFQTAHSPGYFNGDGNGFYEQTIDATGLGEGTHFVTARAFRHREDGGPAIFSDFRRSVYIDRLPANSAIDSFNPIVNGVNENRRAVVRSLDKTANNVHLFLDLPAARTDAEVLAMVGGGSQANRLDRDLWHKDFGGLSNGNHVLTIVSYEISGRPSVQRYPGQFTSTIFGAGLGDLDLDGDYDGSDVTLFKNVLLSNDNQFNPAADFDGNGRVNNSDLLRYHDRLISVGANAATLAAFELVLGPKTGGFNFGEGDAAVLAVQQPAGTGPSLSFDWDLDNDGQFDDASGTGVSISWNDLQARGIIDNGNYAIALQVSDGATSTAFPSLLKVTNTAPTANLSDNGPKGERQQIAFAFINQDDPADADDAAGFRYSFDFNNDGDFRDAGEARNSTSPTKSFAFKTEGTYTVHAQILDKNGGARDVYHNVTVTNADIIVTGTGPGSRSVVRAFNSVTGAIRFTILPFEPSFLGGVTVAAGDVTGDGLPDIVVGAASGFRTTVKVFDGNAGQEVVGRRFDAFPSSSANGVSIAIGDVNRDGVGDIVVGSGRYAQSTVRIVSGINGAALGTIPILGTNGVRVAAGDVNGDGRADIITSPATGTGVVRIYSGLNRQLLRTINPFSGFMGGMFVAAGDLDGDGRAEVIVSQNGTVNSRVRVYRGYNGTLVRELTPFVGESQQPNGVSVSTVDRDGDGRADVMVGSGRNVPGRVRTYRGFDAASLGEITPFGPGFLDGIFVG